LAVAAEEFFDGEAVELEAVVAEVAFGLAGIELVVDAAEPAKGAGVLLGNPLAGLGAEFVAEVEVVAEDLAGEAPVGFDPGDEVIFPELQHLDDDAGAQASDVVGDPRLAQAGLGLAPDGLAGVHVFMGTCFRGGIKGGEVGRDQLGLVKERTAEAQRSRRESRRKEGRMNRQDAKAAK
jgi:hypothetical protein